MGKILIVDDEDQIRKLLARMLELEGYEIYQAADCKTALSERKELSRTSNCVMSFCLMGMGWTSLSV